MYLNPQSVGVIDLFQKETDISRSQIIRSTIDMLAYNLSKLLVLKKGVSGDGPLDELIGVIKTDKKSMVDFSEREDKVYLKD